MEKLIEIFKKNKGFTRMKEMERFERRNEI